MTDGGRGRRGRRRGTDGGGRGALPPSARGAAAAARPLRCSEIPTPTIRASSSPRRCGWGAAAGARAEMEGGQEVVLHVWLFLEFVVLLISVFSERGDVKK